MNTILKYLQSFLLSVALLLCSLLQAQQPMPKMYPDSVPHDGFKNICSSDMLLQKLRLDKNYKQQEDNMNRQILAYTFRQLNTDTITLPVVVHIINPNPFAISDIAVINGINDLNDAFSKSGAYTASTGADTKIRFCIAKTDPDGGVTTGITRTTSYFGKDHNMDNEEDKLKNLIQWDPARFINIWLILNIHGEAYANFSCGVWTRLGVGGYATLPPGGGALDGIVTTGFGKILAHEMGHYLGLYHTFEGGCFNFDCTVNGDRVCDTPPDGSVRPSAGCASPENSCNTDTLSSYSNGNFTIDVPDPIKNFMDYSNNACSVEFTQGQADRMRAAVMTQRTGLLINKCTPPCGELINAFFTRDTAYTAAGDLVNFTNTSAGAINFRWLVNDVVSAFTPNFTYTFGAVGKYKITLKAFNADSTCFGAYTTYVIVNCGVSARFFTNKKTIASKLPLYPDSIIFTNASFRGVTYQWLIGNSAGMVEQVVSTNTNLTYTFPLPANYTIRLVATNGSCVDTSNIYRVNVQDPTADGAVLLYNAYCYQQTKVRVSICVDNYGFAPIPAGTPVNFYDADPRLPGATKLSPTYYLPSAIPGGFCRVCFANLTIDVGYAGLNRLYAVFNDSGNTAPLVLPNRDFPEKNYFNNVSSISGFKFSVTATPALATLLPGDTLQLIAQANPSPSPTASYLWSDAFKLSCTTCRNPKLYADSDRIKQVIATSQYGCKDTAYITIKVPPANDYTIKIDSFICPSRDSMSVRFTLYNGFFRGVIPKNLKVSFYNGNPALPGAVLLPPIFSVPDTVFALQSSFNATIKLMPPGSLYAVVNDSNVSVPVILPNTPKLEKDYTNNIISIPYTLNKVTIDTAICIGNNYFGYTQTGNYTDTLKGKNGCDSVRVVNLLVKPVFVTNVTTAICNGENYAGHTTTGTFVDIYPAINGCDSTRTLFLTVKPTFNTTATISICQDENYAGHTATGTYTDVYKAINGCDSTRILFLTVNPKKFITINPEICEGESFFAGGKLQTTSGIYYDTFRTYLNCDSVKTTNLTVHLNPRPNLGANRGICINGSYTMNPGNFTSYRWQDASTDTTFTTTVLGKYYVDVTNQYGCKGSDTILLNRVLPLPANFLPQDTSLCLGNILSIDVPGYKNYLWSGDITGNPGNITKTATYKLKVTDRFDCVGNDSIAVFFYTNCIIAGIPNAFSPNGDGRNETFKPYLPAPVNNYSMQIYNRLGQKIFETNNSSIGWDGTLKGAAQDPGTFVYAISFKDYKGEIVKRRGTIVLIR